MRYGKFNVRRTHTCACRHSGKGRVTLAYTQNQRSGGRENRLDTRLRKRSHVRHGQGRLEIMRMYSHAKRARKVQRGNNRRVSSPREEDRARNLDKADKDGDDRTRRKGGGRGGEEKEPSAADGRNRGREQGVRWGTRGREYVCKY